MVNTKIDNQHKREEGSDR